MRYPEEHKEQTRDRIVRAASRRFRGRGESNVAIADLMQELKLTHGGFYRHFDSKQELFAESIEKALEEGAEKLLSVVKKARPGMELECIIGVYLSPEHCARAAEGCPIAALASEIARHPRAVRVRFDKAVRDFAKRFAKFLPGSTEGERQRNFAVLFSGMSGALSLARAVADEGMRRMILEGARDLYVQSFCSPR
ncbi:MAG TPA: TetR/AcrR family transcriptional regulator [Terriglobia bacterium]|nr:TetR/AcrR family transcriptional regulator [Terriglobia bacterium]